MPDPSSRPVAEPDLFDSLLARAGVEASLPVARPRIAHAFERPADVVEEIVTEVSAAPHPSASPRPSAAPVPAKDAAPAAAPVSAPTQSSTTIAAAAPQPVSMFQQIIQEVTAGRLTEPSHPVVQHYPSVGRPDGPPAEPAVIPVTATADPRPHPQPHAAKAPALVAASTTAAPPRPASVRPVGRAARSRGAEEHVVRVNIGRLEVTATSSQKHRREPARRPDPRISLDEFLRREQHR
jgi:hypothetical protein